MVFNKLSNTSFKLGAKDWYCLFADRIQKVSQKSPLVVGVFQDQTPEEINDIVEFTGIDLVQLHGKHNLKVKICNRP